MACKCYIVPPQLLQSIADSADNSDTIRERARGAIEARNRTQASRKDRITRVCQGHRSTNRPHGVIPQQLLERLSNSQDVDENTRARAKRDLEQTQKTLASGQQGGQGQQPIKKDGPYRAVYDMKNSFNEQQLPGDLVGAEGEQKSPDKAVNEVYKNVGEVADFYKDISQWNSIDGKGMDIISSVHFGKEYENAFWIGDDPASGREYNQMVFGDGGDFLYNFTNTIDVIGHELTHAVTENTSPLEYEGQSGALNEHVSDVFGIMIKQRVENETAQNADWLIGEGCLLPDVRGVALRSMKAPGTAYNDKRFGKDPQIANFAQFQVITEDNGGVHIFSGIPNKAFYNAATAFGGYSWEKAGKIWWQAMQSGQVPPRCTFQQFADITVDFAKQMGGDAAKVVRKAWEDVGVKRTD